MVIQDIVVFGGSAHPDLTAAICAELRVVPGRVALTRFANDCLQVQLDDDCRERDVYLIQPLTAPVQEHLVELMMMSDAARGDSAARITAVVPYYAYARSDKRDAPRISLGGRLVADALRTSGVRHLLTMALHSPQVNGFFSMPVDNLNAFEELAGHFRQYDLARTTVVAPDLGYAKEAEAFARILGVEVAFGVKQRLSDNQVTISHVIGLTPDRDIIVLDDEIANGSTVLELLARLRESEPRSIRVATTHGLFSNCALTRLESQRDVLEIVCTNTVPLPTGPVPDKVRVLSVAHAFAEAIRRIHRG